MLQRSTLTFVFVDLIYLLAGSKRSRSQELGLCLSSATPASSSIPTDAISLPSGFGAGGSGSGGDGDTGTGVADGGNGSAASGSGNQGTTGGQQGAGAADPIIVEGDDPLPPGKKQKKCTSDVWQYFTKKRVVIEDNGKIYEQIWAHCDFPRCKHKGRCESNYGTTGFWTHLRVAHSIVKGQQQLKAETDNKKGITTVVPYKYDEEASLRKFYLAIVMHEYPFNISEHEYFVEFIKSLRPSFPIKSRVTIRKEIMSIFLKEKDQLYAYFKSVSCRFSATMDMWTSKQVLHVCHITLDR